MGTAAGDGPVVLLPGAAAATVSADVYLHRDHPGVGAAVQVCLISLSEPVEGGGPPPWWDVFG